MSALSGRAKTVLSLIMVGLLSLLTTFPWCLSGFNLSDCSWYFHFGNRLLHGAFPYRDYVFQVGYIPIFVDAGFQSVFGERYVSSLLAAFCLKTLFLLASTLFLAQFAGRKFALLGAGIFAAQYPMVYHSSYFYAESFLACSICAYTYALDRGRPRLGLLGVAGLFAGLLLGARTHTAVVALILLAIIVLVESYRQQRFSLFISFAGGSLLGAVFILTIPSFFGALQPMIQQVILDAPGKKGVSTGASVLDALSGGLWYMREVDFIRYHRTHLLIAIIMALGAVRLLLPPLQMTKRFPREAIFWALGLGFIPIFITGEVEGYSHFDLFFASLLSYDVPYWTLLLLLVIWFVRPAGLSVSFRETRPLVLVAATALSLLWTLQLSFVGRSYTALGFPFNPLLLLGILTLIGLSRFLTSQRKLLLAVILCLASLITFVVRAGSGYLDRHNADDYSGQDIVESTTLPALRHIYLSPQKERNLRFLQQEIPPGSSLFIYGTAPALYTILQVKNPTRVDTTYPDFFSLHDAVEMDAALKASPPIFILLTRGSYPLTRDEPSFDYFYGVNPVAANSLKHTVLDLLPLYEVVPGGHSSVWGRSDLRVYQLLRLKKN
jgi:hypothetical protein